DGAWTPVDSGTNADTNTGSGSAVTMRSNVVGAGDYRYVFSVAANTSGSGSSNEYKVFIDNIQANYPSGSGQVTGPGGQPEIIMTDDQLDAALVGGSPTNTPTPVSGDTLYGGDGNDILFGDVINTDALDWAGRDDFPAGSGLSALKAF